MTKPLILYACYIEPVFPLNYSAHRHRPKRIMFYNQNKQISFTIIMAIFSEVGPCPHSRPSTNASDNKTNINGSFYSISGGRVILTSRHDLAVSTEIV